MNLNIKLNLLLIATTLFWANASHSVEVFQTNFTAEFVLKARGAIVGRTTWSLSATKESLVYELESKTAGIAVLFSKDHIVERSEWRPQGHALKPYSYEYDRSGGKKEKQVSVEFLWNDAAVINTSHAKSWRMPVPDDAIDKLSYVIAMMHDLNSGQSDFEYVIADGGKLKSYTLKSIGKETLQTKVGSVETTKVLRRRHDSLRETTFWCAPLYQYLPVKIEHRKPDGEVITGYIQSVSGLEQDVATPLRQGEAVIQRAD
jgi:hypothetical protein